MYALRLMTFTIVALGVGLYLAFAPVFAMPLYNMLLFSPTQYPYGLYEMESIAGIPRQEVYFSTAGGRRLHGWYFERKAPVKTVLIHHGTGANLTYRGAMAEQLIQSGCSVFMYDYQGYGKSEGSPSLSGVCADGEAAYKYLTNERRVSPEEIVMYGESLGTGVTCEILQSCPCSGLILNSSFYSLQAVAQQQFALLRIYPAWLFPNQCLNNAAVVHNQHPPLLMLHGTEDALCLATDAQALFKEASEPKTLVLMNGRAHDELESHRDYDPSIQRFLASLEHPSPAKIAAAAKL